MLRINLLPIKAAKKHDTAKQEMLGVIGLFLVTLGGIYLWNSSTNNEIDETKTRIARVQQEIQQLKQDVVRVEDFKVKAAALESKITAISGLQKNRVGPARLLDDLATILHEERKVWLTSLVETAGTMTLRGRAMEEENISDFQLALDRRSKHFTNVRLSVVSAVTDGGVKHLEWTMTCKAIYAPGAG